MGLRCGWFTFAGIEVLIINNDGRLISRVTSLDQFDRTADAIESDGADRIAYWFNETDPNEESSFVRHAYLGERLYGTLEHYARDRAESMPMSGLL
jgi:hypothetical protein